MAARVCFRMCERGRTPRTARLLVRCRIKKIAGGSRGVAGNAAKPMSFFRFSGLGREEIRAFRAWSAQNS